MIPQSRDWSVIAVRAADIAFGGLLCYSGFAKAAQPQVAIAGVDCAAGIDGLGFWVLLAAVLVEVVAGGGLVLLGGRSLRLIAAMLLTIFTAYLIVLKWRAPGTPCGCAGSAGIPRTVEFVRNRLLLAGAAVLFFASPANATSHERSV